jgi:hypothetical protein
MRPASAKIAKGVSPPVPCVNASAADDDMPVQILSSNLSQATDKLAALRASWRSASESSEGPPKSEMISPRMSRSRRA